MVGQKLICLVVLAGTIIPITALAESALPFHVEPYQPRGSSTVIVPLNREKSTAESLNAISSMTQSVDAEISSLKKRNFIFGNTSFHVGEEELGDKIKSGYVDVEDVISEGAAWLKIKFRKFDLTTSKLIVTSMNSGRTQTFAGNQLENWAWHSALFDGDRVRVQLQINPGVLMPPLRELIENILVGESSTPKPENSKPREEETIPRQGANDKKEGACGEDKRKPSNEPRVGRMFPMGCTVFIVTSGVYLSAGHCIDSTVEAQEVQFNVPPSTPAGKTIPPAIRDVYPIVINSVVCSGCNGNDQPHGNDWTAFDLGRNNETGLEAVQAQGASFEISSSYLYQGIPIARARIDGFGYNGNPATSMYANQYATGPLVGLTSESTPEHAELQHYIDTQGGNSGSPIIAIDSLGLRTNIVVGIHTGGRCNPAEDEPNRGTGLSHQHLQSAIARLEKQKRSLLEESR